MPVYPVPPEIQALVSGRSLPAPTLGPGLDAFQQSLQRQQDNNRTLLDAIGRQTPGFMPYLVQNHPDIVEELTGPPRMFRRAGDLPLSAKLQQAMQAYTSQPPPAEVPLTPEQTIARNKYVEEMAGADPRLRDAPPEVQNRARAILGHAAVQTSPDDAARAFTAYESLLGSKPTPEMQKFQSAMGVLSDPGLGYLKPDEKAATAAAYATGRTVSTKQDESMKALDMVIKAKQSQEADLNMELKRLEIDAKKQEEAAGPKIPAQDTTFLGNIGSVLRQLDRAVAAVKTLGPLETTFGSLLRAPVYSARASELNGLLSTLAVTFERQGLQLPGRLSPILVDMLKGGLVAYSKTPTELHGILSSELQTLTDIYDSRLEQLKMAGIASPTYYKAQQDFLKPYIDLSAAMAADKKWTPKGASFVQKATEFLRSPFGGGPSPATKGPGTAPSEPEPATTLFGEGAE